MMAKGPMRVTVLFYTLGCKVNQYDTQTLKELFIRRGYALCPPGQTPDVVVVNTCTVTAESDRKGRQAVRRYARRYPDAVVCVTGCMPQARAEKADALAEAHVVIGNALNPRLPELVEQYRQTGERIVQVSPHREQPAFDALSSDNFEGRTRAFVKIEDGCNRFCSFCLIPYARGRVRSKPLDAVQAELAALAANGYREVVLAGIDLTAYGADLGLTLADAVEAAQQIPGIARVRLGSMEPDQLPDPLLDRLQACDKLCPQFHLSLQSGSDAVLKAMNRHYDTAFYADLVARLRERWPGCAVTTDVMCGFPGETDEDFAATLAFMETVGFARVHAFLYSPREGTPAARMEQLPAPVKNARMAALCAAADRLQQAFLQAQVGSARSVLLERRRPDGSWEGHTDHYVPVRVAAAGSPAGQILPVLITAAEEDFCRGTLL